MESLKNESTPLNSTEWDILLPENAKNHEQHIKTTAINIHSPKDDFFEGGEIFPDRKVDSVCRKAKPVEITNFDTYDDVMNLTIDLSAPLDTRFHLNREDFPIFSQQGDYDIYGKPYTMNTAEAANQFVSSTARTIEAIQESDLAIYLDKSARPVSWFVNEFWEEFSDKERPNEANLAIDRLKWFPEAGIKLKPGAYIENPDGSERKATFSDFEKGSANISQETIAGIRALFIPGGVETEDAEQIMQTPTGLEGKNIVIIDEVKNSGSTAEIAKWLIEQAIPEVGSVKGHVFWKSLGKIIQKNDGTTETQMGYSPVWYDPKKHDDWSGRGVLDIKTGYFEDNFNSNPDNYTRAQKLGSKILGEPLDVDLEPGLRSVGIQKEIRKMHEEYRKGHILPNITSLSEKMEDKILDHVESLGITFGPLSGNELEDKNKYITQLNKLKEA